MNWDQYNENKVGTIPDCWIASINSNNPIIQIKKNDLINSLVNILVPTLHSSGMLNNENFGKNFGVR